MNGFKGQQFLLSRVKHHFRGKYAATVGFGHLFDDADNSSRHLAISLVYLLHQIGRRLLYLFVPGSGTNTLVDRRFVIETGINRHRFVVLDPLGLGQDFHCNYVGVQGSILVLERLDQQILPKA